ncbi:MAG: multidrug transporter [Candidatus Saccharibacteria bacterium]
MSTIFLIAYVLSTSFGLILIKLGTTSGLPISIIANHIKFNINPSIIAGIILYGVSFLLYIYLISKFDLGYIIPLTTALVYALIFIASFVVFKEAFTALKIAAISLIIFGVILLNLNK